MGIGERYLKAIVGLERRAPEHVAQMISADSEGLLTVARIRGWEWSRPGGCRFFDTDPMPPAVAQPGLVFRDRESDRGLIVYLTGLADDPMMPAEQRAFARELARFLRQSPVEGVRP